jgi:hypothetical protein
MLVSQQFGSVEPTFITKAPKRTSPKFSFVTIRTPSDLRDKSKQKAIRQHAKRGVDRLKAKKYRARFLTSSHCVYEDETESPAEIPGKLSNDWGLLTPIELLHKSMINSKVTVCLDESEPDNEAIIPWNSLRPLGGGRGFVPFTAYPVQPTSRMIQLFDFGMMRT